MYFELVVVKDGLWSMSDVHFALSDVYDAFTC